MGAGIEVNRIAAKPSAQMPAGGAGRAAIFIPPLHGLRGLAALSVVYAHGVHYVGQPGPTFAGSIGVALFFVLSGFLMAHLYLPVPPRRGALKAYAVARFARIYPLFAAVVVVAAVAWLFDRSFPYGMNPLQLGLHLLGIGARGTVWTISTEFQFYIVFALIWVAYGRFGHLKNIILVLFLLFTSAILWAIGFSSNRIALHGYFHIFAFGMIAAIFYSKIVETIRLSKKLKLIFSFVSFLGIVIWLYAGFISSEYWGNRWVFQEVWLMAIIAVTVMSTCLSSGYVLGSKFMVWLGEISFGIYLIHRPVIWALEKLFPFMSNYHWSVRMFVLFSTVILVSWLANVYLESPARAWVRARLN